MASTDRTSALNGVWLCQRCAKLVDDDEARFTVAVLEKWKANHEADVERQVREGGGRRGPAHAWRVDEALPVIARLLDRPAFTTPFRAESSLPDFKLALSDTIEALNTGVHRLRDRTEIARFPTRHDVDDPTARQALASIERMVRQLRARFDELHATNAVKPCGCGKPDCAMFEITPSAAADMDALRTDILETLRTVHPAFDVTVGH